MSDHAVQLSHKHMTSYAHRDASLRTRGVKSYHEYLESPLWYKKRRRIFATHGAVCVCCGARGADASLVVHHRVYSENILLGDCCDWMVVLCRVCHDKIELTEDGTKRSFDLVDVELRKLCPRLPRIKTTPDPNSRQKPTRKLTKLQRAERRERKEKRKEARKAKKIAKKLAKHAIPEKRRLEIVANLVANPRF